MGDFGRSPWYFVRSEDGQDLFFPYPSALDARRAFAIPSAEARRAISRSMRILTLVLSIALLAALVVGYLAGATLVSVLIVSLVSYPCHILWVERLARPLQRLPTSDSVRHYVRALSLRRLWQQQFGILIMTVLVVVFIRGWPLPVALVLLVACGILNTYVLRLRSNESGAACQ